MKPLLVLSAYVCAAAQTRDVHEVMQRVAANQAKTQDLRKSFVYRQKQHWRFNHGDGRLAREEWRDYVITPDVRSAKKDLVHFDGKYEDHGKYTAVNRPGEDHQHESIGMALDAGLIDGFSDGFTNNPDSRDGIASELFPFTYHQQLKYKFRLVGAEQYRGRSVYRIAFEGKEWKGEALIDATEYQPVFVTTKMAHGVPLVVKTVFGSNVKGVGFSLSYEKFDEGVWFPLSYGGEFELKAAFFYKRKISVALVNSDFRRADVNSTVEFSRDEIR
jgi:hypothetical protein